MLRTISLVFNIQALCCPHNLLPRLPEGLQDGVDTGEEGGRAQPVDENLPVYLPAGPGGVGVAQHEGLGLVDEVEADGEAATGPGLEAELTEDTALLQQSAVWPDFRGHKD